MQSVLGQTNLQNSNLRKELSDIHRAELRVYKKELNKEKDSIKIAAIYNQIAKTYLEASYYLIKPKYDSTLYYANRAEKLTYKDTTLTARQEYLNALKWKGTSYTDMGSRSDALYYFNIILENTENVDNPSEFYDSRQAATTETALIYADQGNLELAIKQYQSLLEYVEKHKIDKKRVSSIVYVKLARFYREQKNLDIALYYANKSVEVAFENGLPFRAAMGYQELASISLQCGDYSRSENYLSKSYDILVDTDYPVLLARYYITKSILAFKYNDQNNQVLYAQKAFDLNQNKEFTSDQLEVGKLLYQSYKNSGDYKMALASLENTIFIERKLTNKEDIKQSSLLEIEKRDRKIEFEQNQRELEQSKSQIKNSIIVIIFLILLIVLINMFFMSRDRKKKIRLAKDLKELDTAKTRFFTNISHELRTPLTLISGPIEQLLDSQQDTLDKATKSKLEMAINSTATLRTLIDDILDLSKIESKKLSVTKETIELSSYIKGITDEFDELAERDSIQFNTSHNYLKGYIVEIDKQKLKKIITNLLSNAFRFTRERGVITLGVEVVKSELHIGVTDTGIGISDKDLPYIFDRYFQSNDRDKPFQGGAGMGLSLVKELLILMKGDIKVHSKKNKGTSFMVTIPINVSTNAALLENDTIDEESLDDITLDHLDPEADYDQKEATILVVEDYPEVQNLLCSILEKRYRVVLASHGEEALQQLRTYKIDLIISDIMMPIMNGYELLEKIKTSELYSRKPIIMLTSLSQPEDKLKALTIGADDYLTKPFVAQELLARIYNLLERYNERMIYKSEIADVKENFEAIGDEFNDVVKEEEEEKEEDVIVDEKDIELINKAADIIEENLENSDFKITDLTAELFLGERQLRRKIKLITGLSPKKFQQEIRLQKARKLFESEKYQSVKAVSLTVGIPHVTRFARLYEFRFGKHPETYFS